MNVQIIGTGYKLPQRRVTNEEIAASNLDVDAEWTKKNLGIESRYICGTSDSIAQLAWEAAREAMHDAKILPDDIDLIIVATATADMNAPSIASIVQKHIGARNATSFDINAICSGWTVSFLTAASMIEQGMYTTALIIGADVFSTITDWFDRSCVFFGDGAGATIIQRSSKKHVLGYATKTYAEGWEYFKCVRGGTFEMNTKGIFKTAQEELPKVIAEALRSANIPKEKLSHVLPHQASIKTLKALAETIQVPWEAFKTNMDSVANTAGGTLPILLAQVRKRNEIHTGQKTLFVSIGSGMTMGAIVYEW